MEENQDVLFEKFRWVRESGGDLKKKFVEQFSKNELAELAVFLCDLCIVSEQNYVTFQTEMVAHG